MRQLFCILTIGLLGSPCLATNALRGKSFSSLNGHPQRKEWVVDKKLTVNQYKPTFTHQDMAEIMPSRFVQNNPTRAGLADRTDVSLPMVEMQIQDQQMRNEQAVNQIVQNTANKIMKSEIIKDSFLMKTARTVEQTTKMDVAIKQTNSRNQEIEHKFKVDVQALQGSAKIQYTGLVDSRIEYQAANSTFVVSLEEKLSSNSKIALSHLNDREQTRQLLQYQLNW
ncbi:MAG: hypothetical protein AAF203_04175 [Pseudomonadota bacterium]